MDWNWFFSALAQSTAAIVGLIGAFVFTRIVNNESQFNRKSDHLSRILETARDLANRADILDIGGYNRSRRSTCLKYVKHKAKDRIEAGEDPLPPEYYVFDADFSIYDYVDEVVAEIDEVIEEAAEELEEEQSSTGAWNVLSGGIPMPQLSSEAAIQIEGMAEQRTRSKIDSLRADVERHAETVERAVSEAARDPHYSEDLNTIIVALFTIFVLGVIYPLANLPAIEGSEVVISLEVIIARVVSYQALLLLILTALFGRGAWHLYEINESLRHDPAYLNELSSYSDVATYSPYLTNPASLTEWKLRTAEKFREEADEG